ncbi:hypothetical protein GS399_13245 [Pedobacter sp. HMF7647]|uniref:Uncharacterized protein n=1 Tax=Hufsiella arboris TaxID=2695275 RepID=A0A7K1YBG8_9SPHI|nr:hypothetical protein [Hufsiella arboris]MXV51942.1 hypothetical protein [Hufsiella arboris]
MNNLDDLRTIWLSAKTDGLPDPDEMKRIVKKFRSQKLRKKWLVIVMSCLLSCLIMAVLAVMHFKFITTYIGGGLMAASGLLLAFTNFRSLKRFYELDDCSNLEFLAFIEQTRRNQEFYYKKTMVAILLLCSIGLILYLYEPGSRHLLWLACMYAALFSYLGIMWFVVRPRMFKRDAEKLEATRKRLENISKQLN